MPNIDLFLTYRSFQTEIIIELSCACNSVGDKDTSSQCAGSNLQCAAFLILIPHMWPLSQPLTKKRRSEHLASNS